MMAPFFRIKSWSKYQHYKKRNPPWIKLHRELLQSRVWVVLDDASRVLALASMMLAAATNNKISTDPLYLQRVAYLSGPPDLKRLAELDFIEFIDDSENDVTVAVLADASKRVDVASLSLTRDRDREDQKLKSKPPLQQERSTTTVSTGTEANANGSHLGGA